MFSKSHSKLYFNICLIGLIGLSFFVKAQPTQCGTIINPAYQVTYQNIINQLALSSSVQDKMNKEFVVTAHIIKDTLGAYNFTIQEVEDILATMDTFFEPINATFILCETNFVDNWQFTHFIDTIHDPDLYKLHYRPQTINIYFVNNITKNGGKPAGFAATPGGPDIIVIKKSAGASALVHELGHFFGLMHTFDTDLGIELVNGSNCTTAGDLICDTDADINPAMFGLECINESVVVPIQDPIGEYYSPPINNIMSYWGECRCKFTRQQYDFMVAAYKSSRNYLW